jgi:hypothetical protein
MSRAFSSGMEYLGVIVVACVAAAVVVVLVSRSEEEEPLVLRLPTCRDAGIVPGTMRQGTCTTRSAVVTVAAQGNLLVVPGLRARATDTTVELPTTASGRARRRLRVSVEVAVTNTGAAPLFSGRRDPSPRLSIGPAQARPDRAAQRLEGAFVTTEPLPPGETRRGFLRFELAGGASDTFRRVGGSLGMDAVSSRPGTSRTAVIRIRAPRRN